MKDDPTQRPYIDPTALRSELIRRRTALQRSIATIEMEIAGINAEIKFIENKLSTTTTVQQ